MIRRVLLAMIGLAVGLGLGLLYAWVVSPVKYTDTAPASLREVYKTEYIQLAAQAFVVDGDLDRARARLAALGEANPAQAVTALAQRTAASGGDAQVVRSLAALASALGAGPSSPTPSTALGASPAPTSLTPGPAEPTATLEPTLTPVPTVTPFLLPTRTPTPTPLGAFNFVGKQAVCDSKLKQPLIQVLIMDANGEQVPGVEVVVDWEGGFDHFFTGLKPELGSGYGDFTMTEGVNYTVHLAASPAAMITDLAVETCTDTAGKAYPGSWLLVFRQP